MRHRYRKKYRILFVISALCIMSYKYIVARLFTIQTYNFVFDQTVNKTTQNDIALFITETSKNNSSLKTIAKKTKEQFPFLNSITLSYLPSGYVHGTITTQKPHYLINNDFIVTAMGVLYKKEHFTTTFLHSIPHIKIPLLDNKLPAKFIKTVQQLPHTIFDAYTMRWITDTEIQFIDKNNRQFFIVTSTEQIPQQPVLDFCSRIKQEKIQINKNTVADIRFNNQVIIYTKTRG